jgi:hypothetical protein
MYAADDPAPLASSHLRIARPSRDLARTERFWVRGPGLQVPERAQPQDRGGHRPVMLGWPGAAWHPELARDPDGRAPPAPPEEDLLVLYLGQPAGDQLIGRLAGAGGRLIPARNPYWDRWGVTIADPYAYRLVLSHRTWQ